MWRWFAEQLQNPSLQAKKRTEVDILKTIHEQVYEKAKITVNVKVEVPEKPKANVIEFDDPFKDENVDSDSDEGPAMTDFIPDPQHQAR